ncbi:MAG: hypothetical protein WDO18_14565 [Acidobacteriota bacterium]
MDRLKRADEQSRTQRETSQAAVAQREEQRFEQEKVLESLRAESEGLQARAQAINEEHSMLRAGLAGIEERQRSERNAVGRIEAQIRQIQARRDELARLIESMGTERARLLGDNVELDKRAAQLTEETAVVVAEVEKLQAAEAEGRAALAALDESLRTLRSESQSAQERRSAIELELVKKQGDLKHLDENSRKDLNLGASEIQFEGEIDEAGVLEAEEQSNTVRSRIEALGPVNSQALEEFQEATQRYEFLNTPASGSTGLHP